MTQKVIVSILHDNLVTPVTGIAMAGISNDGTEGVNIFIPTGAPETLINLIKVKLNG